MQLIQPALICLPKYFASANLCQYLLTSPDANLELLLVQILDVLADEPIQDIGDDTFEHHPGEWSSLLRLTHSREEPYSGSMLQSGAAVFFSSSLFALFLAHSVNVITFIYITVMVLPPTSCSTVFSSSSALRCNKNNPVLLRVWFNLNNYQTTFYLFMLEEI